MLRFLLPYALICHLVTDVASYTSHTKKEFRLRKTLLLVSFISRMNCCTNKTCKQNKLAASSWCVLSLLRMTSANYGLFWQSSVAVSPGLELSDTTVLFVLPDSGAGSCTIKHHSNECSAWRWCQILHHETPHSSLFCAAVWVDPNSNWAIIRQCLFSAALMPDRTPSNTTALFILRGNTARSRVIKHHSLVCSSRWCCQILYR